MYHLTSKWTILPGKKKEALAAIKELAKLVREREPDTLVYLPHSPDFGEKSLPTPADGEITFFEIYKNKKAFNDHVNGKTFKSFVKKYGKLFLSGNDGQPFVILEILKYEAGFIRAGIY
jgi:quinol monooxygenase YgiN